MSKPQLAVVPPPVPSPAIPATAVRFAETVRVVGCLARRGRLVIPVFRAPPRRRGIDRTIRRAPDARPVVAVRLEGRPMAAVRSDVIEGTVVANELDRERADRFRRAAWAALEGCTVPRDQPVAPTGGEDTSAAPGPVRVA